MLHVSKSPFKMKYFGHDSKGISFPRSDYFSYYMFLVYLDFSLHVYTVWAEYPCIVRATPLDTLYVCGSVDCVFQT